MSERVRFSEYVRDFELAWLTGEWQRLEPHFTPDARHRVPGCAPLACDDRGRRAVVAGLRRSVEVLDRRFDARIAEILEGPTERDGGLWMRFGLRFERHGLPALTFAGDHLAVYDGAAIARLDERLEDGADARVAEYLERHAAALRPEAAAPAPPSPEQAERIREATLRSLVRGYAAAKSQQDVEGALSFCAEDFGIDTLAFGVSSHTREETALQLELFFRAFPDYRAEGEGLAVDGSRVAWWGRISLTSSGALFGLAPTGRRAEIPAFCVFELRGVELVRERFHFDLHALCDGLGLPVEAALQALAPLRASAAA